jgi:hypothetical protein
MCADFIITFFLYLLIHLYRPFKRYSSSCPQFGTTDPKGSKKKYMVIEVNKILQIILYTFKNVLVGFG